MKLIKNLGMKKCKDRAYRYGLFYCKYCKQEVKKKFFCGLKQKSCGCIPGKLQKEKLIKHGESHSNITRLYNTWNQIKARCNNPNNDSYKYYGGKGIRVCKKWENSYIIFKIWAIAHGYQNNLTIDRRNNNKGYLPENCRWISNIEQQRNRSNNKLTFKKAKQIRSLYRNIKISQVLLAKIFNISTVNIYRVIHNKNWI